MSERPTPAPDFEAALDAAIEEAIVRDRWLCGRAHPEAPQPPELPAARARVLALYAAREGEILCDWVAGVDDDIWATACGKYYQVDVEALTAVAEFGVVHCPCGGRIVVNAAP